MGRRETERENKIRGERKIWEIEDREGAEQSERENQKGEKES